MYLTAVLGGYVLFIFIVARLIARIFELDEQCHRLRAALIEARCKHDELARSIQR